VDGSLGDSGLTTDGADGALLGADAAADAAVEASLDADAMTDGWDGALLDASPPVDGAAEAAVDSGATVDGARSESGTQVDGPDGGAMALDSGVDGEAGSIRSEGGVDSGVDASDGGPPIEDEVGFVDVPRQRTAATYPARMFYVFEAADSDPSSKPLAVFFNGGPGAGTTFGLLPYGTARYTLDESSPTSPPVLNPARWTSFANLLYIDERQSGFSYGLESDAGTSSACAYAPVEDAADFIRTLLAFLDSHAMLRSSPVILVGESYGGTRATYMLDMLLKYSTEASRADSSLQEEIQSHYDAVFPSYAGVVVPVQTLLSQFGHAVLIEPLVVGAMQFTTQTTLMQSIPKLQAASSLDSGVDIYDVLKTVGWSDSLSAGAAAVYSDVDAATDLLTRDPRTIPRIGPADRAAAFRVAPTTIASGVPQANEALSALIGQLNVNDAYLTTNTPACGDETSIFQSAIGCGDEFVGNLLAGVHTFITNAANDAVIYSPAILYILQHNLGTADKVTVDDVTDAGTTPRPGGFTLTYTPDGDAGVQSAHVRFPPYANSGHMVATTEPQNFHDDVVSWFHSTP